MKQWIILRKNNFKLLSILCALSIFSLSYFPSLAVTKNEHISSFGTMVIDVDNDLSYEFRLYTSEMDDTYELITNPINNIDNLQFLLNPDSVISDVEADPKLSKIYYKSGGVANVLYDNNEVAYISADEVVALGNSAYEIDSGVYSALNNFVLFRDSLIAALNNLTGRHVSMSISKRIPVREIVVKAFSKGLTNSLFEYNGTIYRVNSYQIETESTSSTRIKLVASADGSSIDSSVLAYSKPAKECYSKPAYSISCKSYGTVQIDTDGSDSTDVSKMETYITANDIRYMNRLNETNYDGFEECKVEISNLKTKLRDILWLRGVDSSSLSLDDYASLTTPFIGNMVETSTNTTNIIRTGTTNNGVTSSITSNDDGTFYLNLSIGW